MIRSLIAAVAVAISVAIALSSAPAAAAGRKVLVLAIDGDAEPALRERLATIAVELSREDGAEVTTGDTTLAESAAAIGCDPVETTCAEAVRATLGVDELVFGSARTAGGETTIVISRISQDQPRRDETITIKADAKPEAAEPALRTLFVRHAGSGAAAPSIGPGSDAGTGAGSGTPGAAEDPATHDTLFATRERKLGYGFAAGGTLVTLIGLALWSSESSLQSQIDSAPTRSLADIQALRSLEDRANAHAWEGNVAVVLGLAAIGVGTYYLVEDHRLRATATPAANGVGAVVGLGGPW